MCASKLRMFDIFGICIPKKLVFITLLSELPGVAQVIHSYSRRKFLYNFLSLCSQFGLAVWPALANI